MISGSVDVVTPGSTVSSGSYQPSVLFTDVTSELYYKTVLLAGWISPRWI